MRRVLACNHSSIFDVHRAALDGEHQIETLLVGKGQVLLAVAGVALPCEPERDTPADDGGRYVRDALLFVADGRRVGRHEGVHHDVATVIFYPGENSVAVGETSVFGKADACPSLSVFRGDDELDRVVDWSKAPDELIGTVALTI